MNRKVVILLCVTGLARVSLVMASLAGFSWVANTQGNPVQDNQDKPQNQSVVLQNKRNLSKDEEERAFRRKNRQDPNPDRKGKAINVKTEETVIEGKRMPVIIRSSHVIQFIQVHMRQEHGQMS